MNAPTTGVAVADLRETMCALHGDLVRWGLVTWTSGNVSGRVPGADRMVIKPSGIAYDELTPESMVVTDLHGQPVDGSLPSSDTLSHAYIYREMPDVNGIVHTHSTYATAWAARHEAIPCVLTAMADEFGGEIPVAPFAADRRRGDRRGRRVHARAATARRPCSWESWRVHHRLDGRAAVKAAVMCEDVARTVHHARMLGTRSRSIRPTSTACTSGTRTPTGRSEGGRT